MIYCTIKILVAFYIILLYYFIVSECVNPAFGCYMKQVCAAEMAVRYAALCASRKVHT